jgi:hypothetical protein
MGIAISLTLTYKINTRPAKKQGITGDNVCNAGMIYFPPYRP